MTRLTLMIGAASLALGCAAQAHAQPPVEAAAQQEEAIEAPGQICLTNACAKPAAVARPPVPRPDRPSNTTLLPKVGDDHLDKMIEEQNRFRRERGEEPLPPEAYGGMLGISQHGALFNSGAPTSSIIPDGMVVEVEGAVWLADGGYQTRGVSIARGGTSQVVSNPNTGGAPYGSATTYSVNGDMISIHKAIQIGNQPMIMSNLTVRSGQTATVQLPDGSVFQVTPTLRPAGPGDPPPPPAPIPRP